MIEEGGVSQDISGNQNTQINSGNDTIAAIGDGAIAVNGNITFNSGVPIEEHAKLLADLKILEEKMAKLEEESDTQHDGQSNSNKNKEIREEIAKSAVEFYEKNLDREGVEFSPEKHSEIANTAVLAGKLDVAIKNLTKAMEKSANAGNKLMESRSMLSLGTVYTMQTKLELADAWLQKALKLTKENQDDEGISAALSNLSIVEQFRKDYIKSASYLTEALDLAKKTGNKRIEASILGNLGNIESERGDLAKAMDYYLQSKPILYDLELFKDIAALEDNLGFVARKQKNYVKSHEFHMSSYLLRVELGDRIGQMYCMLNMSVLAIETQHFDRGKSLANKALELAREVGDKRIQGTAMNNLAQIAMVEGDKNAYLEYTLKIKQLEGETGVKFLDQNE